MAHQHPFFHTHKPAVRPAPLQLANQVALVVILLMLVAVATACSRPPQPRTEAAARGGSSAPSAEQGPTPGQRLDQATSDVKQAAGDAGLTAKVKTALANEAGLNTLKIDVDANGGVITLKGQVDSDDTKKRVEGITQKVPGVTWVQNYLSIAPKAG